MSALQAQAQYAYDTYYNQGSLVYEDHIYQEGIRTARLHPRNEEGEMPIISLSGRTQLTLQFDDLFEEFVNYSYTIYHCNADWTPSTLMSSEYLSGLTQDYIQDYTYSINALIPYTHYQVNFPNEQIDFTKSGNYLVVVFRNDDPEDLVLSKRFMVYEEKVAIGGRVKRPTQVDLIDTHQEIDFTISHPEYNIQNPFSDLQVHLMQNQRFDNAIRTLKPRFLQNSQLVYQYDKENTFPGLNEFRFFDIKNLLTLSQNVRNIERDSLFHVFLAQDQMRAISNYVVWPDINGRYIIRRLDAAESATEADYALVDFFLSAPQKLPQDVYVFGQLSDWKLRPEFKLYYDEVRQAYRGQVYLKQGYYNYHFATVTPNDNQLVDVASIEGSHWETENEYQILVYNRELGTRYDKLIGYQTFSSQDLY